MAELKTKATAISVADYIAALPEEARRADAVTLDALYRKVTGFEPKIWGPSIIGYGSYSYKYDSGHEGTMCRAGFSPRKGAHTLYVLGGLAERPGCRAARQAGQAHHRQGLPLLQEAGRCGFGGG